MPKLISTKELRTQFPKIRKEMEKGESFILLHRSQAIGQLTPMPKKNNSEKELGTRVDLVPREKKIDSVTYFNANSPSFDFLREEPELYTVSDLKKRYV